MAQCSILFGKICRQRNISIITFGRTFPCSTELSRILFSIKKSCTFVSTVSSIVKKVQENSPYYGELIDHCINIPLVFPN